jgi:hypothetical protein
MSKRLLTVQINKKGQQIFSDSDLTVGIVRSFGKSSEHCVVCAMLTPFGDENIIEFSQNWLVYASVVKTIKTLHTVTGNIELSAEMGKSYTFDGIKFCDDTGQGSPGFICIKNKSEKIHSLIAGLSQGISIQGREENSSPVNIASIPLNMATYFEPLNKIKVFIASGIEARRILPSKMLCPNTIEEKVKNGQLQIGTPLEVQMNDEITYIHYDNTDNLFVLGKY